jgi:transposase
MIVPHCDTAVFQIVLDAMAVEVPKRRGKRVLLVLDNASWHKTKSLCWHHIESVYLPPYSPDFNPIERLWQHLKGHYLAGYFTKQSKDLSDKLVESIQHLMNLPKIIRSVCKTHSE